MKKLQNKVAVITGGNSGIGLAIANSFNEEGAELALFGRNQKTLNQAASTIGNDTIIVQGDVTNLSDLDKLFDEVKSKHGKIDTLVVNAGGGKFVPMENVDEELFDQINNTNFKGAYFTIQKALPLLKEGSTVIIVSSVANVKGIAGMTVYSATKAAVRSLARTLAAELAPRGIRVNSLSPGPIDTPIFDRLGIPENDVDKTKEQFSSMVPLQRLADASEMASVALFLASQDSSYVTGADIAADGGLAQV
jgi:NAD(P)-dependent dehydrogenase (short-subunit alcohol dehydrogenase family)